MVSSFIRSIRYTDVLNPISASSNLTCSKMFRIALDTTPKASGRFDGLDSESPGYVPFNVSLLSGSY